MRSYHGAGITAVLVAVFVLALAGHTQAQDDIDNEWPREMDDDEFNIVFYQPQLESFSNDRLEARAAVAVTPAGSTTPVFGALWIEARLATDLDARLVSLERVRVTATKFPDVEEAKVAELTTYLEREIPQYDLTMSLDRLLAEASNLDEGERPSAQLNNDPPEIIVVDHPAVLVLIDGDPIIADLDDSDLKYVANSAFFIVKDAAFREYYLRGDPSWYVASDIMGPWQTTTKLPKSVQEISKQIDEEQAQQAAEQGESPVEPPDDDSEPPEVIVSTVPAELVVTDGKPNLVPLEGTTLLFVDNTENDIVLDITSQRYYLLLSGRWYAAPSMAPGVIWTFISPNDLPAEFAKIPEDSDMGQVLASVAGTQQAKEAVLENQIPQTAEVDRKTASVTVAYDGDPKFEQCADNGVAYAVNTDKAVLLIDGTYYCCDNAIWFLSQGPEGPWQVATQVPDRVQDIPPECPVYNVKYVYIYDSTPDVVYVGYTPAYTGAYYYNGVVVWGTGWWYRPWYASYYYPRPTTWGFRVHYNPVTGWGFSFGVSVGWLHIGVGRPWYGGWWGPCGYRHGYRHGYRRGYRHGYHQGARAGYRAGYRAGQRNARSNVYRNNRSGGVRHTGASPAARPGQAQARKQTKPSNRQNNVYADKQGNVHRNQGGDWQQQKNGQWSSSQNKSQSVSRDHQSRERGNQRSSANRSAQRSRGGGGKRR